MKLPWGSDKLEKKEEKIQELENKISALEEDKESWKKRFESEEDRRKELSRKKQKAEEELNRLKDKLRSAESVEDNTEKPDNNSEGFESLSFTEARNMLQKLDSMESGEKDMVTVYSPDKLDDLEDVRGLKNSISKDQFSKIEDLEGFVAFLDQDTGNTVLKMTPFYRPKFVLEEFFDVADILEFFKEEKIWVIVSAGNTRIYREQSGRVEEVESIKSRVNREHSKGGFSQGRFERKRDEQIDSHVDQVKEELKEMNEDNIYLLGEKSLCKELPGKYYGGFDPNRKRPEQFYQFKLKRF